MTSRSARPAFMTLTPAAVTRIKALIVSRGKSSLGVRVGVRSRGCTGLSYTLEYADEQFSTDEVIPFEGGMVLVDSKASLFLLGTEMDFVEDTLKSGFIFRNPNEKGQCGCGESFHV